MPPKKKKNATRHRITGHFIYLLIESKKLLTAALWLID